MPIKIFRCEHAGAPALSGATNALIDLLDACLVNGYGGADISSITRSATTATVTTSLAHGYATGDWIKITGADQAAYNGEFQITITSATTFTYQVSGSPATPATSAAGMDAIRAPAGFDKVFVGTNKAVFRAKEGLRHFLQVLDDGSSTGGAKEARMRGFVSMTDVDTGVEPFPTVAQRSNGLLCYKSNAASTSQRPWLLISDGKTFYLHTIDNTSPSPMALTNGNYTWIVGFGQLNNPSKVGDAYCSFLAGMKEPNQQASSSAICGMVRAFARSYTPTETCFYMPRSYTGVEGAVTAGWLGHGWDQTCLGQLVVLPGPHPTDNGFYCTPMSCAQGGVFRGPAPGLYEGLHGRYLMNSEIVENVAGLEGRKLMSIWGFNANNAGHILIDITGPWS